MVRTGVFPFVFGFVGVCCVLADEPICVPDLKGGRICSTHDVDDGEVYSDLLESLMTIGADRKNLHDRVSPKAFSDPISNAAVFQPNSKIDVDGLPLFNFLEGPESIAKDGDTLYAATNRAIYKVSMKTGENAKVYDGNQGCTGQCSRPLGIRVRGKQLFCADALKGLIEVNLETGTHRVVLPIGSIVQGEEVSFPDDIDVDFDKQIVYMSDASTKWDLHRWALSVVENDDSARILRIDVATGRAEVFANKLRFANGVQISNDKKHLLVNEFSARRILKYRLSDAIPASPTVFTENLPGNTDNIRPSLRGGYWVGLALSRFNGTPTVLDELQAAPALTEKLVNAMISYGTVTESTGKLTSNPVFEQLGTELRTGSVLLRTIPKVGTVVELDENGKVLQTLHSYAISFLTEALEYEDGLLIGSFTNKFLFKVPRTVFRKD